MRGVFGTTILFSSAHRSIITNVLLPKHERTEPTTVRGPLAPQNYPPPRQLKAKRSVHQVLQPRQREVHWRWGQLQRRTRRRAGRAVLVRVQERGRILDSVSFRILQ